MAELMKDFKKPNISWFNEVSRQDIKYSISDLSCFEEATDLSLDVTALSKKVAN